MDLFRMALVDHVSQNPNPTMKWAFVFFCDTFENLPDFPKQKKSDAA